jgi:hypothetical protein
MSTQFARAEDFIWRNARLIDRQLFAYQYKGGSADAVLRALRAYQNSDGGFGNGLEPDMRTPTSQPVPAQHALEYIIAAGGDAALVSEICGYLPSITTAEGGVPFVLPSVRAHPRAPWWETGDNPPASINPTASLVGLLYEAGVDNSWLAQAEAFCWPRVEAFALDEVHALACVIMFLRHVPDRKRAEAQLERIGSALDGSGLVADPSDTGYVRNALDWAPTPDHPFRKYFTDAQITAALDALVANQQDDGGWTIAFPPPSPAAEIEWRGWVTLNTLNTLKANGRLT